MKSGFVFMASYYEAMRLLPEDERHALLDAMMEYVFEGVLPEGLPPGAQLAFTLIRPNIDASVAKYTASVENGKKGGRPRRTRPKKPDAETQQ